MKYLYTVSWCVVFLLSTDSTFINNQYKKEKDCGKTETFIDLENAKCYEDKLKKINKLFTGYIYYENIKVDSVLVDTTFRDEILIKMYR